MDSTASSSHVKQYKPYLTASEVERLSAKQRGKLSVSREERLRQQACGFLDSIGTRCGFPRRTIAMAQTLYMRFHLFFPYKDFIYMEVALSTLYVSSKLHDTLKKPRDILLSSYALRFPHLVKKGVVDPTAVDQHVLEGELKRVLNIERLVLETMCFKFGVEEGFELVVKLAKAIGVGKETAMAAWRIAVDCHRSLAPVSFPPHIIALGSLYTASLLQLEKAKSHDEPARETAATDSAQSSTTADCAKLRVLLGNSGLWEETYSCSWTQIDDVTHHLLDLYITILSTPISDPAFSSSPSPISPKDPQINPQAPTSTATATAFRLPAFWTPQTLTELKIHLRDRRPGEAAAMSWSMDEPMEDKGSEGLGKNDGTVRFLWDVTAPPAQAGVMAS